MYMAGKLVLGSAVQNKPTQLKKIYIHSKICRQSYKTVRQHITFWRFEKKNEIQCLTLNIQSLQM